VAQDNGPSSLKPSGQRDTLTARALRTMAAEQRAIELEGELCSAREGLAHRDNAISSLEKSLDLNSAESARLATELANSAAAAERGRAQLERTRSALSAAQAERNEAHEKRQAETARLDAELEAALARATSAENQLAEAHQSILTLNFHNGAAEKRTESLETSLRAKDRELQDLKQSHANLADEVMKLSHEKIKLSEELAKLSNEASKLSDEASKLTDDKINLTANLVNVSNEVLKLSNEKTQLADNLVSVSNELVKLSDEISAREAALAHAEDRIGLLAKLFMQLEAKAHHNGRTDIAGIAGVGNLEAAGRIGIVAAASGKPGECAVLKRDLDSDAWLFGGGKPARLS
jgi:chromosome segregation ATPase